MSRSGKSLLKIKTWSRCFLNKTKFFCFVHFDRSFTSVFSSWRSLCNCHALENRWREVLWAHDILLSGIQDVPWCCGFFTESHETSPSERRREESQILGSVFHRGSKRKRIELMLNPPARRGMKPFLIVLELSSSNEVGTPFFKTINLTLSLY